VTDPDASGSRNGYGFASLGSAVVGLVYGLASTNGFGPLIFGMIGLVLGIIGWVRARREDGSQTLAITANVVSLAVIGFGVWKTLAMVADLHGRGLVS
jgi:hypothetical protein